MDLSNVAFPEFVDLTKRIWVETLEDVRSNAEQLFMYQMVQPGNGNTKLFNEYDVETFASLKPEGDDAVRTRPVIGYSVTMTARRFAKEIIVSYEARQDNRYREVYNEIVSLAKFGPQRKELDLTHILSFADSTSYTDQDGQTVDVSVGDGLAMVSASHTLVGSATTYSNVITGNPRFSQGALEIAEYLTTTEVYSNYGERRVMEFNTIVTGDDPTTVNDVKQLLQSSADVDQNNSGVANAYYRKYSHIILPRLASTATGANDATKRYRWFLLAKGQWQGHYCVWESSNLKTPAPGNNGEDIHNDNWTFGCRMRYGIRVVSGKGILMSTGV